MPKLPTPEDRKTWESEFKQGWPIKSIAERTGFSPDTVSRHLKEVGAKKGKEAPGVGGAVDIMAEFNAFKARKQFDEMKEGLKAWVENEILRLDFDGAEDLRANLEWIRDRADKVKAENEIHELYALVETITNDAHPLIEKHEKEIEKEKAKEERYRGEAGFRFTDWQKMQEQILRQVSYNTISAIANQMGLQISEHFKTAVLVQTYEQALFYVQAILMWTQAEGDPNSFLYYLQSDPYFLQRIHTGGKRGQSHCR